MAAKKAGLFFPPPPGFGPKAVPLNQELETSKEAGERTEEKPPASTQEPESEGPTSEDAAAA